MKHAEKALAIAIFLILALQNLSFGAISVGGHTTIPQTLRPGEEGAIVFSITNSPQTATVAAAPLENVQVFFGDVEGLQFISSSPLHIGTIESGSTAQVSAAFRILPKAKGGVITVPFYISQKDKTDLKTLVAVVRVVNPPVITLATEKQTVLGTDELNLTIRNDGGLATKMRISLSNASSFKLVGTTQIYVGDVKSQTSITVPLDSRGAAEGLNSIPFVVYYQQEGGEEVAQVKNLPITVKKEKANIDFSQKSKIITKTENRLELSLKNTGREISDLEVYFEDEKIQAKDTKQFKLGSFAQGQEKTLVARVFVNAEPGVSDMKVRIKWNEDNIEKEDTLLLPIAVSSDADTTIYIDAKPAPLVMGGEHTLSITVSNIGSYKIQNVEIALEENPAFEIFNAQKEQYIGGLESDDFSSVQYKVRVKAQSPGTYLIPIIVKYKDKSGVWVEKEQKVALLIRSQEDARNGKENGSLMLFAFGALAVAVFAYWYFRMRKPKGVSHERHLR